MTSPEFDVLHIIHVASAFLLIGITFYAFAADPARRQFALSWGGVASLLMLLSGIRMWQGQFGFVLAGWIVVKIVCWLALSALAGIGFQRRGAVGLLMTIAIVLGAIAVAMAYLKPF